METNILAEWLEHYIEEAWLPLFEHPISTWTWGGAAILPTRVFRNWPSGSSTKLVTLTIEGRVMSHSSWSAYAEDNYKDLCTIKIVPTSERESDVFVSSAHAALENYLVALLSEVKKRFGETCNQIVKPDPEDGVRGNMWQFEEETAVEQEAIAPPTEVASQEPSPEADLQIEDAGNLEPKSEASLTGNPESAANDTNEPKIWEQIEDKGYDRQLVELWHQGYTVPEIRLRIKRKPRTLWNRLYTLRKEYGPVIVPLRNNSTEV